MNISDIEQEKSSRQVNGCPLNEILKVDTIRNETSDQTLTPADEGKERKDLEEEYPLNENTRDGCYVCSAGVIDESTLQRWKDEECSKLESKFLKAPEVNRRMKHEMCMASHAWANMEQKIKGMPKIDLYQEREASTIALRLAESMRMSVGSKEPARFQISSYLEASRDLKREPELQSTTMPVVEEPPPALKGFPLTRETKKKYIEKETILKKEEKREAVLMLQKKQEELRKLKNEFKRQAQRQHCHKAEREAVYETRKAEYLENLAKERNVDLDILKKHGDEIYRKYRKECKLSKERKEKKIDEEIAIVEKLLREERLKEKYNEKKEDVTGRPSRKTRIESETYMPFDTVSWEKMMIENVLSQNQEAAKDEDMSKTPVGRKTQSTSSGRKKSAKSLISKSIKNLRAGGKRASIGKKDQGRTSPGRKVRIHSGGGKAKHVPKLGSRMKSSLRSSRSLLTTQRMARTFSNVEIPVTEWKSIINSELLKDFKTLDEIWNKLKEEEAEIDFSPKYDDDHDIGVSPQSIIFRDFYPAQTQLQVVKLYNKSNSKIHCGLHDIFIEPVLDKQILQVFPPEIIKLWPGECRQIEVSFSPIEWGTEQEISGKIWFWTRHMKGEKRRFLIDVKCLRAQTNPVILHNKITFPGKDWWKKEVHTSYLTIENRGAMPCSVYVHRSSERPCLSKSSIMSQDSASPKESLVARMGQMGQDPTQKVLKPLTVNYRGDIPVNPLGPSQSELSTALIHEENLEYVESMLAALVEEACSPFRVYLTRGRELNGYTAINIPIKFAPYLLDITGYAQECIQVTFEGVDSWTKTETVRLFGWTSSPVIEVEPDTLDMSVLVIGSGVQQLTFIVKSITSDILQVNIKLPQALQKHFHLSPVNFTLRPSTQYPVLIRAQLGFSFCEDAVEFLTEESTILEFNLLIQPEGYPANEVLVLATIADPLGLTVDPGFIDFGIVNTTETAVADIWITNNTMLSHNIAFLNIPKWCLIMPDHGFTEIGPCEKRRFEILYSPSYTEAGKPGGQAEHTFTIKCTTAQRISNLKNMKCFNVEEKVKPITEVGLKKFREEYPKGIHENKIWEKELNSDQNTGVVGEIEVDTLEEIDEENFEEKKEEESFSFLHNRLEDYPLIEPEKRLSARLRRKKENIHEVQNQKQNLQKKIPELEQKSEIHAPVIENYDHLCAPPCPKRSDMYVKIRCRAVVVDPLCELSQQRIIIPATPITSFSTTQIYLSCPSKVSGPSCECGIFKGLDKDPRAKVTAHFEFFSDNPFLNIEPATGDLLYGEKIRVILYFKPELNDMDITNEEKQLKIDRTKHSKSSRLYSSNITYSRQSSRDLNRNTTVSEALKHHKQMEETNLYNAAKLRFFKKLKRTIYHVKVKCLIETKMVEAPFSSRIEVLNSDVVCPVTRPDFIIKTNTRDQQLVFPCTAVGFKSKKSMEIHNISGKTIFLTRNLLDIDDTFYTTIIPGYTSALPRGRNKGLMLEPEEFIRIKVIYYPKNVGKDIEYLEFKSNLTTVQYKLTGEAKLPHFKISPQFNFLVMDAFPGYAVDQNITVVNDGEVPIYFTIIPSFEKESLEFIYENALVQQNIYNRKTAPKKSVKSSYFSDNISGFVLEAIDKQFVSSVSPIPITIEPKRLKIDPGKSRKFKVTFNPSKILLSNIQSPSLINSQSTSEIQTLIKANVINDNMEVPNPSAQLDISSSTPPLPTSYVKHILLALGGSEIITSWTIMCFVKKKISGKNKSKADSQKNLKKSATSINSSVTTDILSSAKSTKKPKSHKGAKLKKDGSIKVSPTEENTTDIVCQEVDILSTAKSSKTDTSCQGKIRTLEPPRADSSSNWFEDCITKKDRSVNQTSPKCVNTDNENNLTCNSSPKVISSKSDNASMDCTSKVTRFRNKCDLSRFTSFRRESSVIDKYSKARSPQKEILVGSSFPKIDSVLELNTVISDSRQSLSYGKESFNKDLNDSDNQEVSYKLDKIKDHPQKRREVPQKVQTKKNIEEPASTRKLFQE